MDGFCRTYGPLDGDRVTTNSIWLAGSRRESVMDPSSCMDPSFGVILRRTSKILPVKLAMSPLPISIITLPTQGMSISYAKVTTQLIFSPV